MDKHKIEVYNENIIGEQGKHEKQATEFINIENY